MTRHLLKLGSYLSTEIELGAHSSLMIIFQSDGSQALEKDKFGLKNSQEALHHKRTGEGFIMTPFLKYKLYEKEVQGPRGKKKPV